MKPRAVQQAVMQPVATKRRQTYDIFNVKAVDLARDLVEVSAFKGGEQNFNRNQPPNSPSLNAAGFFSVFYWRLRFGGPHDAPIERLAILARDAARDL